MPSALGTTRATIPALPESPLSAPSRDPGWLAAQDGGLFCPRSAAGGLQTPPARDRSHERAGSNPIRGALDWRQLQPVIDELLGQLPQTARSALLLRYFEGRSYPEVAAELGLTEPACRKRVGRALEQLRARLRRRGIVSTSLALETVLSASATVTSASAGLASQVAAVALSAPALPSAALASKTSTPQASTAGPKKGSKTKSLTPTAAAGKKFLTDHPEAQKLLLAARRARPPLDYAGLYQKLNLTPAQIAQFAGAIAQIDPLNAAQADQLVEIVKGATVGGAVDWAAVTARSQGILSPSQLDLLGGMSQQFQFNKAQEQLIRAAR